ncbi:unnamed protein product [Echinostoma caproni]|uniref:Reverse transcriptase n=1 Tax=Echinostoma caproni TaxID=27848 RepID=A0A183AV18_9TREM|nr:unnamed protein product [Echinostoma caproni]
MERGVRRVHLSTKATRVESHLTWAAVGGIQRIRLARVCRAIVVVEKGPPSTTLSRNDRVGSTLRPSGPDGLRAIVTSLSKLGEIRIPRRLSRSNQATKGELHLFEASETGYGAEVYVCWQHVNGEHKTELSFAKARVAPLKCVLIPHLELTAAVLAVRIVKELRQCFRTFEERVNFRADSTIVKHYVNDVNTRFSTFV